MFWSGNFIAVRELKFLLKEEVRILLLELMVMSAENVEFKQLFIILNISIHFLYDETVKHVVSSVIERFVGGSCEYSWFLQNVTLTQVLEADDILQECKADNKALIQL